MNQDLQSLEIKVENDGTTPQGRLTAAEWNILVAAVKSLDLTGGSADAASILQVVANAGYATQEWVTSQKYITSSALDNLAKNLVTLDTTQAITGMKDFTNGLKIGGMPVYKLNNSTIFIDANLVVTGAFTMHGSGSTTFPTIWANIPFDSTMRWDGSQWSVVGGGSSSGSGGGISIADVEYYLTINGYATQDWVTGNGYITSDALGPYALKTAIPTNTNQLTNGAGFITASAIPTSLKNPNALSWSGYSSGSYDGSTAQSITIPNNTNQLTNGAGFITGITSSMVTNALGYTPYNSSNPAGYITSSDSITGNAGSATTLKTSTGYMYARAFNVDKIVDIGADATFQGYSTYIDGMYIRFRYGSANVTAMQIGTDGKVAVGGTTADELLHVYGVAKATLLKSAQGYTLTSSAATYCGLMPNNTITGSGNATDFWLYNTTDIKYQAANHYFVGGNVAFGGTSASEKLHVHGNMLFDGERVLKSSLIGEVLYMGGSYLVIGGGTTAKGIPTYIDGKTVYVRAGNYVATFSDAGGLTWNGNLLTNGALTMNYSSDERLKKNIRKVNASEVLMSLGGVWQYEYIDSEVQKNSVYDGTHFGLIYQNVKGKSLDKMCHKREDGMGALNYVDADFISIIAGATMETISEVEKLKKENKALRKEVELLKQRVA